MRRLLPVLALIMNLPASPAVAAQTPTPPAASPATKGATATLADCLKPFAPARQEKTASGWAHWFLTKQQSGGINVKMSYVDQATAPHAAHTHPEDEVFYILEGTVIFELNGATATAGPGTALYCPGGSRHGLRRAGAEPIKYLVIKSN